MPRGVAIARRMLTSYSKMLATDMTRGPAHCTVIICDLKLKKEKLPEEIASEKFDTGLK